MQTTDRMATGVAGSAVLDIHGKGLQFMLDISTKNSISEVNSEPLGGVRCSFWEVAIEHQGSRRPGDWQLSVDRVDFPAIWMHCSS